MLKLKSIRLEIIKNRYHLFSVLLITVLGVIIYSNSFSGEFQFDDGVHIVQQNRLNDLSVYSNFSNWKNINNRPLAYFTLALNRAVSGNSVFGYHLFNLIIHILTSLLVYNFVFLILLQHGIQNVQIKGREKLAALFVALVFLCHPIQTQAVTYIVQRMTSMSALFYLASAYFYLRARLSQIKGDSKPKWISYYLLMLLAAIASMLSKQIAVTLPLIYLLMEFFFVRNKKGERFNRLLLFGLIAIVTAFILLIIGGFLPKETEDISHYNYFVTQLRVIVKYVQLLVIPISQNLDYDFALSNSIFGMDELFSALVVAALVISIFTLYRKHPLLSFGIAWFFISLMVESSIIPIRDVIFEHRLYLPMFGFAIFIVMLIIELLKKIKQNQIIIFFSVLIVISGVLTFQRNKVWKSRYSLWYDVVQKSPAKARPHLNLGIAYLHMFKPIPAIEQFNSANKIDPKNSQVYYDRAEAYLLTNRTEEAIQDLNQSILLNDKFAEAFDTRGKAKLRLKDFNAAIDDYSKAIEMKPELESAWFNRATAYLFKGEIQNALEDLKRAIELNPNFAAAYNNRGQVLLNLNLFDEAIRDLSKAITLEPRLSNAFNNRAKAYYALQRYEPAIVDLTNSLKLNPGDGEALKLRGICYLDQQKINQAYLDFMKARELGAPINDTLIEHCEQLLKIQK